MKFDLAIEFDVNKATAYFNKLVKDKAKIDLIRFMEKRTIQQNKYLHVCLTIFGNEFGYTLAESKTLLKRQAGLFYIKNNDKFLKSTADLDTQELTQFIDFIRTTAEEHGCYIPTAEEYKNNSFTIDKDIEKFANYKNSF
jgi:hypothetical protein